ncbi:LppP/LprE family lipoprotein [Jongsikchunia kroppenstedtii]|uniref:LppP/LprE family lipoprotein n=1 Tax=Jongsikchunia kroppenstedtii TaxID=1121721 RepID=UPI00037591F0|nr:LppP/LprE family lipoprotein [Jongsikchunia kroppenstedtii]
MNRHAIGAAVALAGSALVIAGCSSGGNNSAAPSGGTSTSTVTATKSAPPQTNPPGTQMSTAADDPPAHDAPASDTDCGVPGGASAAVSNAISQIAPPLPNNTAGWQAGPANLDGCRNLSYVTLDTQGATASSPNQLLLFHKGRFLGTGTKCNLAYQQVTGADDTNVHVTYQYLIGDDDISAHPSGRFDITYHWTGSQVQMIGSIPAEVARDEC